MTGRNREPGSPPGSLSWEINPKYLNNGGKNNGKHLQTERNYEGLHERQQLLSSQRHMRRLQARRQLLPHQRHVQWLQTRRQLLRNKWRLHRLQAREHHLQHKRHGEKLYQVRLPMQRKGSNSMNGTVIQRRAVAQRHGNPDRKNE